jgi:hypothetical protein
MNRILISSLKRPFLNEITFSLQKRGLLTIATKQANLLGSDQLRLVGAFPDLNIQKRFKSTDGFMDGSLDTMAELPITQLAESLLINLHDMGALEWSTTIFLAAFAFRLTVCFPIKIYQEHQVAKTILAMPAVQEAVTKNLARKQLNPYLLSSEQRQKLANEVYFNLVTAYSFPFFPKSLFELIDKGKYIRERIYKRENIRPQKVPMSSLLQFPLWFHLSAAIRHLTKAGTGIASFSSTIKVNFTFFYRRFTFLYLKAYKLQAEQIANEQFLWIESLAVADPHYVLPAAFLLSAFVNYKVTKMVFFTYFNCFK